MSADQPTLAELRDQRRSPTESQPTRPSWSVLIYAALAERGPLSTYKIANAIGSSTAGRCSSACASSSTPATSAGSTARTAAAACGHVTDENYAAQRTEIEARLAAMSEDDKLVQFDRARAVVRGLGNCWRSPAPTGRPNSSVSWSSGWSAETSRWWASRGLPQVRPMMSDGAAGVPLEGIEPPTQALGRPRSIR